MGILQAAVLGLIALILLPGWSFYFDLTPKTVTLLTGTAVLLVLEARRRLRPGDSVQQPLPDGRGSAGLSEPRPSGSVSICAQDLTVSGLLGEFDLLAGLALASLALSTWFSGHRGLSLYGGSWRQFGALTQAAVFLFAWLLARNTAGRPANARLVLRGVAMASSLAAMYGMGQYFGLDPLQPRAPYHVGEGMWTIVRPPGTLGYVSYFATWMLVAAFLSRLLAELENSTAWRRLAYIAAALSIVSVILSGARAAMLGLAAGAVVEAIVRGWRPTRRAMMLAGVLVLCAIGFYFSPAGWNLRSRARWYTEDPFGGARLFLWRDSFRMAMTRPAAGFGPETFSAAFPRFESRRLAIAFPDFAHESPHNIVLDSFVAQGVPGLAVLALAVALAARCVTRLRGRNARVAAPLGAALAAGFLSQQFTSLTAPTGLILLTALALGAGLCSGTPRPYPRWALLPAAATSAALLVFAFRLAAADHALATARQAVERREWANANSSLLHYRSYALSPAAGELWFSRAVLAALAGERDLVKRSFALQSGLAAAIHATESAEQPFNAWYNAAGYYALLNERSGTEHCLRMAIQSHPLWFKPHWTLARLLWLDGRAPEAEHEAGLAAELDGRAHPEVARTLAEMRSGHSGELHK